MEIDRLLIKFIKKSKKQFKIFRKIANDYKKGQYKTEKWLQAQLAYHFVKNGYKVIPEYNDTNVTNVDLKISKKNEFLIYLEIINFSDSRQSSGENSPDWISIKDDLEKVANDANIYLLLILPIRKKNNYTNTIIANINKKYKNRIDIKTQSEIMFKSNEEGIKILIYGK